MSNQDTLKSLCAAAKKLGVSTQEFWTKVREIPGYASDMEAAARKVLNNLNSEGYTCYKCNGSGRYVSPVSGRTGKCYPCAGKGYMTLADEKRTDWYWVYRDRVDGRTLIPDED